MKSYEGLIQAMVCLGLDWFLLANKNVLSVKNMGLDYSGDHVWQEGEDICCAPQCLVHTFQPKTGANCCFSMWHQAARVPGPSGLGLALRQKAKTFPLHQATMQFGGCAASSRLSAKT